jgi:lysine-specific histone demethylase 1
MAGSAAFQTERDSGQSLVGEATAVLRSVFGPSVPEPIEAVVTRWGQDKFAYGSYSYTGPDFKHDDYEVMAKPVGNLFFAGEHTCGTHPATVHGAYISGLRAASEVLEAMIGPIVVPEPLLVPKDNPASLKRKASELTSQEQKDPTQKRLEAYEVEIWNAIYAELGERPWAPPKVSANPYILYGKDNFDLARRKCEEGRRPGKGKPVPNEVRIMLAKMWKDAPESEKKPYNERAAVQKLSYASALAEYNTKAAKWDSDALAFRRVYELEHPSVPGPEEKDGVDSPGRRGRKAKRFSGYAEDSGSDA